MAQSKDRVVRSAKLVWQGDGGAIQEQIVNEGASIMIGREPGCDIVLMNKLVSKRHALIYWQGAACVIADQNSANGTLVNGSQVTEVTPLKDGDRIEIGETVLSYYFLGERLVDGVKTMPLPRPGSEPEAPATGVLVKKEGGSVEQRGTVKLTENLPTIITDVASVEAGAGAPYDANREQPTLAFPVEELMTPAAKQAEPPTRPKPPTGQPPTKAAAPPPPAAPAAPSEPPTPAVDRFAALIDEIQASLASAQLLHNRWKATQGKLETMLERANSTLPRMAELGGKVNEAGLIDLLDNLVSNPTDVNLLVDLARHAGLLSRLIKAYYNQEAAINLLAKELEDELRPYRGG